MSGTITLGVMQGRLSDKYNCPLQSFPWFSWRDEFARAAKLRLTSIEWLLDGERDMENPIASNQGRDEINELCEQNEIHISSLCAHTFIDGALLEHGLRGRKAVDHLSRVLDWAWEAKSDYVVLPAMEAMSLSSGAAKGTLMAVLESVLSKDGPVVLLESDLRAAELMEFIDESGVDRLGVLYDIGNATALGFDVVEDLALLKPYLLEIHIKDRKRLHGPSTRLGEGDTLFNDAAQVLAELSWRGPVVLETPTFDNWRVEAEHNVDFLMGWCEIAEGKK